MATTIKYKGTTIGTADNNTKTLKTAGKYMEADVILTDVTSGASAPNLQAKTNITPSTSSQTITPDNGYDGLSSVQINAMPPGAVTSPATISGTAATLSTGTNTITLNKTISNTPNVTNAGYISSGTAGNTIVSLTADVTTKAAATITPGTLNQTIASGTYLTGTQTITGDADLVASNIKHDVDIFGTTGTFGMKIDTMTGHPSSRGTTITFSGLKAQPKIFACNLEFEGSFSSARTIYSLIYDGTTLSNCTSYRSGSSLLCYKYTNCTWTYNNGTLTITSPSTGANGYFQPYDYHLIYCYEE